MSDVGPGVYGVGVGPGDPRLLTIRAADVLAAADLVIAPRGSRDGASLAYEVVRERLTERCAVVEAEFPMAESGAARERAWVEAADRLAEAARRGRVAVMITLGDASTYSTWGYVERELRRGHGDVEVTVVPGVSAPAACAAAAGVTLAAGRDPLLVWPSAPPTDLAALLAFAPNIAFLKAGKHVVELASEAARLGAQAVAVRRCGMDGEAVAYDPADLGEMADYFTTVLVRAAEGDARPASEADEADAEARGSHAEIDVDDLDTTEEVES